LAYAGCHPERHVANSVEQDGVEVCPREREAGPDAIPQLREVNLDEQPTVVVADALPGDHDSSLRDCFFEAQGA
jgi:hypothetical protein